MQLLKIISWKTGQGPRMLGVVAK